MAENLEQYNKALQSLNEMIVGETEVKKLLFHNSGLFGGLKESHSVLELFASYLIEIKKENHHLPPSLINSGSFLRYLKFQKSNGNNNLETVIEKIESMEGKIQNEPTAAQNTLYQFADVLENLGILEPGKENLITSRYNDALENVIKLSTTQTAKSPVESVKTELSPTPKPEGTVEKNEAKISPTKTPAASTGEYFGSIENEEETDLALKAEQSTTQSTSETRDKTANTGKSIPAKEIPKLDMGLFNTGTLGEDVNQPAKKTVDDSTKNNLPTFDNETSAFGEKGQNIKLANIPTEESGIPEESKENAILQSLMNGPVSNQPRIMRSMGGGLRKPSRKLNRLSDDSGLKGPQNRGPEDNMEAGKNRVSDQNQQPEQLKTAAENEEEAVTSGEEKHLGKTLAKLAGGGVFGGTILPLLGASDDTTAKAATFITHIIHFNPVLSIIHLFIK